jgi:helicase
MKVEKLLRYGIPEGVIESWRKNLGEELLPLQALAVTKYDLLNGQSLIISAPTSSGKTFCGEMASVANLFKRKKVIYLVPLKAIAEEKFSDFVERYSDLGIKVVISTKDRQEHDRKIAKGDFDLAIMIYEKFNQFLIRNMDILSQINLIIVDELQMIADPSRGSVLELALLKIRTSKYRPQILGLSAVLKDVDELSSWLGCKLLLEKSRPVELLQGILLDGKLFYRKYNSKEEGTEDLVRLDSEEAHLILFANLEKLVKDKEQVLVFLKSKFDSENCASLFSEKANLSPCLNAIDTLSDLENTTLKQKLIECLQKGVAFHNADLTFDERRMVEYFYLQGEIRVIFSTTTLSMGVNLPAKTVFVETQKYQLGEYSGKTVMLPISSSEYENMSGRAGRFGLEKDFGRSIMLAANKFHFDSLWEGYIEGGEEKIIPQLDQKELEDVILDLIASGSAKNASQLKEIIKSSLTECVRHSLVRGAPTPNLNRSGVREPPTNIVILEKRITLDEKVEELIRNRMLLTTDNGKTVSASKLGALCALKGISVQTGLYLKKKLEGPLDFDPFSWFYDVLDTKDGEEIYISVFPFEEESKIYEKALAKRYGDNQTTNEKIRGLLERKIGFSHKETQLVKLSLLLMDWITPQSTLDLENKYLCRSGQIDQIGKKASWLLDAASGIARVLNLNHKFPPPLTAGGKGEGDIVRFLKNLSQETSFGVDQRGLSLAKQRVPGLGRDCIWNLVQNDFHSKKKIKEAKLTDLEKFIPIRVAERLKEKVQDSKLSLRWSRVPSPSTVSFGSGVIPPVAGRSSNTVKKLGIQSGKKKGLDLVIDGSGVKDKFLVLVNGKRVNLPAKSFKYLVKLTWALFSTKDGSASGGQNEEGWIHKNDFEPGENQTRYLHRLKNQIKPYLDSDQTLFENNRLGSYRLTIPRQRIKLNPDALLKNPDAEIKKMVEEIVSG